MGDRSLLNEKSKKSEININPDPVDEDGKRPVAVRVSHVGMKFNLSSENVDNLKEYFIKLITGKLMYDEFWALKDISFELKKGDRLGVIGLNGAGKSTLLKIVAGVYKPTEGTVTRNGKIAPLLELGAGFDKNYTGSENIYLYGALLGYSKEYINEKYDEIVEFSGLEKFMDVPLKNYSSGMKSRLGFAVATSVEPDILILDEVLSVGDTKFRRKSEKRVMEMFNRGVTVLFVSHSISQVERLCNKAILLEDGRISARGNVDEVVSIYNSKIESDVADERRRKAARKKKKAARRRKAAQEKAAAEREAAEKAETETEAAEKAAAENENKCEVPGEAGEKKTGE